MPIRGKAIIKNLGKVYSALFFTLGFSILMSFYTPKILGVEEFSYWQLFLFYAGYVGMLHLGLNDGIYLKYGGKKLTYNDKQLISGQFGLLVITLSILFCILLVCLYIVKPQIKNFSTIAILVGIYAIVSNASNFCSYLLQAINEISIYSKAIIADKLFLIIFILVIGFFHIDTYWIISIAYIIGTVITLWIILYKFKDIIPCKFEISKKLFSETFANIKCGINLMLSNVASNVIIGICRFLISISYPIIVFGYVSFTFTLCNFILIFISQIGIAIYPILRTKDYEFHKSFFPKINNFLSLILPFSLILYPLLGLIVKDYLPKYETSFVYFAYLVPICFYDAKTSSLLSPYMKVFRKEKLMLCINVISSITSVILSLLAIYIFKSIILSFLGVCIAIMIRNILYSLYLHRHFNNKTTILSSDILIGLLYYALLGMDMKIIIVIPIVLSVNLLICFYKKTQIIDCMKLFISK